MPPRRGLSSLSSPSGQMPTVGGDPQWQFRSRRHHAAGGTDCALVEGEPQALRHRSDRERHRHRYEVNEHYVDRLVEAGLKVAGRSVPDGLVEMIELPITPGSSPASFIRSSPPRRVRAIPCSSALSARRWCVPNATRAPAPVMLPVLSMSGGIPSAPSRSVPAPRHAALRSSE